MSYILDALKKSELERHKPSAATPTATRRPPPTVSAVPAAPLRRESNSRGIGRWYWIFGGALLVNGGITLYHHYSDPRHQNVEKGMAEPPLAAAQLEKARMIRANAPSILRPPDAQPSTQASTDDSAVTRGGVPLLKDKPASFRHAIPKMNVDLHVYAERPTERFALINMSKFREGDEIGRGLVLERITPTGLIISHSGDRFRIDTRY